MMHRNDPRNADTLTFTSDFMRTGKQISEADDEGCAWEQYCALQSAAEFVREWC